MPNRTRSINILFYCDNCDETWTPIDGNEQPKNAHEMDMSGGLKPGAIDDKDNSAHRYGKHEFGFGILKKLLEDYKYSGDFHNNVKIAVNVVNRNYTYKKNGEIDSSLAVTPVLFSQEIDLSKLNFITADLLEGYSQIWIFGMNYGDGVDSGRSVRVQENKFGAIDYFKHDKQCFTTDEVKTLETWMDAGNGVLITGDHSNYVYDKSGNMHLYNLGRSLGIGIKRVSELRVWENGASGYGQNAIDTTHSRAGLPDSNTSLNQSENNDRDMVWMRQQEDAIAQNIIHSLYRSYPPQLPHMLFQTIRSSYNPTGVVNHLADHVHEGVLNLPNDYSALDKNKNLVWPTKNGVQPKPQIVAWGINYNLPKEEGLFRPYFDNRRVGLVTAYDGHSVNVGNIVAHSTWHHFTNVNLVGFLDGKVPTQTLLHISDYFVNLAVYLNNPIQPKSWFDEIIYYEIDLIPHPLPPEVTYGGEHIDNRNPVPNRWTYTHEIGQRAINRLTHKMNPVHLQYYIYDQINAIAIEHNAGPISTHNISYAMVLGEIINAASLKKSVNKELHNSNYVFEGVQQAFRNYVQIMEAPLNPLKSAIESIDKKLHSNNVVPS